MEKVDEIFFLAIFLYSRLMNRKFMSQKLTQEDSHCIYEIFSKYFHSKNAQINIEKPHTMDRLDNGML